MDERVIKRGEVYWVSDYRGNVISVHSGARPAIVVSSDSLNSVSTVYEVVYLTSQPVRGKYDLPVKIESTGKTSYAQCGQIFTVSVNSLGKRIATLTLPEMLEVESAIKVSLGLSKCGSDLDAWEDERRELEEEIASLKAQQGRRSEDTTDIRVERDMWKKMYEKALEMLVEKNMAPEKRVVVAREPEVKKRVVVASEPKVSEDVEKININTASAKELKSKLNCSTCDAYSLTGYRNKNGNFVGLEELREVKNLSASFIERYGERLTI